MNDEVKHIYHKILTAYCLPEYLLYKTSLFITTDDIVEHGRKEGIHIQRYTRHPIDDAKVTLDITLTP